MASLVAALDRLTAGVRIDPRPLRGARQTAVAALVDEDAAFGLRASRRGLVDSAAAVSDLVSPELLQAVQDSADAADSLEAATAPDARETLERLLGALAAVAGLAQETMVRGPGWFLLDIGRRVERALALLAVLRSTVVAAAPLHLPAELLEAVLAQSASLIAYRRRYRSDPELGAVVGLLLLDAGNPRSLRFQLDALAHDLGHLPEGGRSGRPAGGRRSRLGAGRQRGCGGRLHPRPAGARRDRRGAGRAGGDHHRRALRPGPLDQPRVHRPGDRVAAADRHRGGRRGPGLMGAGAASSWATGR